jgi:hypothetical protein
MNVEIRYNYRTQNYRVLVLGNNNKVLSVSETFKRKAKAIQNIVAQIKTFAHGHVLKRHQHNASVHVKESFSPFNEYWLYLDGVKTKVK